MATTDIDPCRGTADLENKKFALNSQGDIVVRVGDDDALAVLEQILLNLGGTPGTPFHDQGSGLTQLNTAVTLLSGTVPAATSRQISRVTVTSKAAGRIDIKVGGAIVGSGRLGAATQNRDFIFSPAFQVATGVDIEVEFTMTRGPNNQDVECYLMALDVT